MFPKISFKSQTNPKESKCFIQINLNLLDFQREAFQVGDDPKKVNMVLVHDCNILMPDSDSPCAPLSKTQPECCLNEPSVLNWISIQSIFQSLGSQLSLHNIAILDKPRSLGERHSQWLLNPFQNNSFFPPKVKQFFKVQASQLQQFSHESFSKVSEQVNL